MNRDELDQMWQQALTAAVKEGEMYTRYHFAELVAEHEREECAKRLDAVGCDHCAANIRGRACQ